MTHIRTLLTYTLVAGLTLSASGQHALPKIANTFLPQGESTHRINNTAKAIVATSPPMGWNSWNNFGLDITEDEFKKQVDYAAEKLRPYGYEYMVIDASWYSPSVSADPRSAFHHPKYARHDANIDEFGRLLPAANKFPSAKGSLKYLADYVHAKGMKFGIHLNRGIPWQAVDRDLPIKGNRSRAKDIANPADICEWFNATYGIDMSVTGAQEYYNSVFELYASWGIDFVKVDDLSMPYHADEITAIRKAIERTGRQIIFSTSPGSTPITARYHVMNNADMFRISSDFWDNRSQLRQQFNFAAQWATHSVNFPGRWPDLDMLPFGKVATRSGDAGGERFTNFTKDEQYSVMTLWSIARSPLIIGNDLLQNDPFTLSLLTNPEVIEVNQKGNKQREILNKDGIIIWESIAADQKSKYLAVFNQNDHHQEVSIELAKLGFTSSCNIRDLWKRENTGASPAVKTSIPAHGARLFRVTPLK